MHADAIKPGQRVLIVDDLLATGGTVKATIEMIEKLGGVVAGCAFLVELDELLDVGDHFGIGEFLADLFVFELQTVQSGEYGIVCHII